jgi:hypothetical protein
MKTFNNEEAERRLWPKMKNCRELSETFSTAAQSVLSCRSKIPDEALLKRKSEVNTDQMSADLSLDEQTLHRRRGEGWCKAERLTLQTASWKRPRLFLSLDL